MKLIKKRKHLTCMLFLIPLMTIVWLNPGCKDPHDYQPPEDTLAYPPDPPILFHPMDDTFFYKYGVPYPLYVTMEWSYIEETEFYLLQVAGRFDSLFADVDPVEVNTNTYTLRIDSNDYYYWRVCAYSPHWKWYTAWSSPWSFMTHYFKP
jgi:hypothetical protein